MSDEPTPPGPAAEAQHEARARQQRTAQAFLVVFGSGSGRSEAQSLVLDHLTECAGDEQNSYRFHEARDGVALIAAGIHRDGARSMLRIIERQLKIAANAAKPPAPKPAVKRQKGPPRHA